MPKTEKLPKNHSDFVRLLLLFLLFTASGIVMLFSVMRADALSDRLENLTYTEQIEHLSLLTEYSEQIGQVLLSDASPQEQALSLARLGALAASQSEQLPFAEDDGKRLHRFFHCLTEPTTDRQTLSYYAQALFGLFSSCLQGSMEQKTISLPVVPPFGENDSVAAVIRTYRPENALTSAELQKLACRFLGNNLSLKKAEAGTHESCVRYLCDNGFCDIDRYNGQLLRLAIYRKPIRSDLDKTELQKALCGFLSSVKVESSALNPISVMRQEGMWLGISKSDEGNYLIGISAGSGGICCFDRSRVSENG